MLIFLGEDGEPVRQQLPDHISLTSQIHSSPLAEMSEFERQHVITSLGTSAESEFRESFEELERVIRSCAPVDLLTHFAYYDLLYYGSRRGTEYEPVGQNHVEFLQAILLSLPELELSQARPTPEQRLAVNQLLEKLFNAFGLKRIHLERIKSPEVLREQTRLHTQNVRNPGSQSQVIRNLRELFLPLDSGLVTERGVSFNGLITVWEEFSNQATGRLNSLLFAMKKAFAAPSPGEMINVFGREFGLRADQIIALQQEAVSRRADTEEVRNVLANLSEEFFPGIFTVAFDEILNFYPGDVEPEKLRQALDLWSQPFGALASANKEHLFLGNPVWHKPIIKIDQDGYFWPIIGSFISFGLEMLEDQFAQSSALKTKYHTRRARFLEEAVTEMLTKAFPSASIFRGLQWTDLETGQNYETDMVTIVDHHVLIFECKSGRIKDAARRGGDSLIDEIKQLIRDPTEQGFRFAKLLLESDELLTLRDKDRIARQIDRSRILRITRVNILLDFPGPLACEYLRLKEMGVIGYKAPAAVTMPLVHLEDIFYLLESPLQRIHYLHQRAHIQEMYRLMADEMDLLAYYLSGNFSQWPKDLSTTVALYGCSSELEPYLSLRDMGLPKQIPLLKLTEWWADILSRAEERQFDGWTEVGIALLSLPFDLQEEYRRTVLDQLGKMQTDLHLVQNEDLIRVIHFAPGRDVAIGTLIVPPMPREELNTKCEHALYALTDQVKPADAVLIAVSGEDRHYPYRRILVAPASDD
jgi:hypothetical protein